MSSHSLFSPSKGVMWMECNGALAQPENQQADTSSTYADDGTASHTVVAWALTTGKDCHEFPEPQITLNGIAYEIDEERITRCQTYVDDVRRDAIGGILWVEYRVDLSKYLGYAVCEECGGSGMHPAQENCLNCQGAGEVPQGGTSDAIVILPKKKTVIVDDFKDGAGEKVYASYFAEDGVTKLINHQLGLYLGGVVDDVLLLGYDIERLLVRIHQPRLNHLDEFEISPEDLRTFMERAAAAVKRNGEAMVLPPDQLDAKGFLKAGLKICRWCRAKANCKALERFMVDETRADFDDESGDPLPLPDNSKALARAYKVLPLIKMWVKAVDAAVWNGVSEGKEILGPDGKPMKFVEGKEGNRAWEPGALLTGTVESLLAGQLGPKAYEPQKPITAPAAKKLLDKKATKQLWKDVFEPLVKRGKPGPALALGSDTRPPYGGKTASATEFDDEIGVEL